MRPRSAMFAILSVGFSVIVSAAFAALIAPPLSAQRGSSPPSLTLPAGALDDVGRTFAEMRWRAIGPFRGGRTKAIVGVPSQPNVFYIGAVNGGVWKTDDFGRTWNPIFDDQSTGSIGDIAVAPSNPNVVYVVSGEGLQRPDLSTGDGVYKSTDAGKRWTHLGLREGQQLPRVIVDPRNADHVFVAVLGHPYGPNEERGVYTSTDGGKSFQRVLYKDENTGASDVELDPSNPDTIYACLWEARQGPWENAAWSGTNGGIFKSTDGGKSWKPLTKGLPEEGVVQADVAVAPSNPRRLYASVATPRGTGIYRSDDSGDSWQRMTDDPRPAARIGGGDLTVPTIDPKNADTVYFVSTVIWKSTDGGKTYTGIRGAPGGDDYQRLWINPDNPSILASSSDQGAIVSVNGGATWSSWYNQPTSQMYHAAADNAFPYRVCGGQQESGSACVSSRGNDGEITFREWHPVGVEEYGYAAPDPLDPDIVYGGKVSRYDRRTGQTQQIGPKAIRTPDYRVVRTQPVLFSPVDPHLLYFAANRLWKTIDGGHSWQPISPDLARETWEVPESVGKYRSAETATPTQRGVIYAVAPSPLAIGRIWAGTDDGLIHVTTDGGLHWQDVTPKALTPWAKVSVLDAGHFDAATAYAAVNTLRLDELKPHIYRTHDGGKTWTHITSGIPDGETVNAVREDPVRKGLLFAGTERSVYISFDDGDRWSPLRLNMPATSVRDVIVKNDDLIAATHGRGFWILDNITPLRQVNSSAGSAAPEGAALLKPQVAYRIRWNTNTDTPIPPDEAAGTNPPDGAMIDYWLGPETSGAVTLEIDEASGVAVRRYSSDDPVAPIDPRLAIPTYWVRPPRTLSLAPGMHRFVWDLHYAPAPGARANYPIAATPHDTAPAPTSPWVMPGAYTVKLTANGRTYTQPLTVKMDPRVKTSPLALTRQFTLSRQLYDAIGSVQKALGELRSARGQIETAKAEAKGPAADALAAFDKKCQALEGQVAFGPGGAAATGGAETFNGVGASLGQVLNILQGADVAPTVQAATAAGERKQAAARVVAQWTAMKTTDLDALNATLKQANLPAVKVP